MRKQTEPNCLWLLSGSFALNIQEIPDNLAHDFCPYAQPIEIGTGGEVNITVQMEFATEDPEIEEGDCISVYNSQDRSGFFYALEGTGEEFTVTVESPDDAARITVLEGTCEELFCNFERETRSTTFQSSEGTASVD